MGQNNQLKYIYYIMQQLAEEDLISSNRSLMPNETGQTNSFIAAYFQSLKHRINTNITIQKSRVSSSYSEGSDPNLLPPHQNIKIIPIQDVRIDEKVSRIQSMDEHRIPVKELCDRFGCSLQYGLSSEEAMKKNVVEEKNNFCFINKRPAWMKFLRQITNWFWVILWFCSILCIVRYVAQPMYLSSLYLTFFLIITIQFSGAITFKQTIKPKMFMINSKNILPLVTKVLRDGRVIKIPSQKLLKGDIVEITAGDIIPADIRIISSFNMKINSSILTGETQPFLKSTECSHPDQPLKSKNLAFLGTECQQGRGRGIVINTGENSILGQIGYLATQEETRESTLRIQINRLVLIITIISLILGSFVLLVSTFFTTYSFLQTLDIFIGIMVASIPEGLIICIMISIQISTKKLAQKKILVKNRETIETLGSTSCIFFDKTEILTQNKITVQNLWFDGEVFKAQNVKEKNYQNQLDHENSSFKILHQIAIITSEARFDVSIDQYRAINSSYNDAPFFGDSIETALIKFYHPIEDIDMTRNLYPHKKCADGSDSKISFDSTNKYSLSIVKKQGPDYHYLIYVKGAPEKIWKFCSRILHEGEYVKIGEKEGRKFNQANQKFSKNGQKVLGFAMLPLNKKVYHKDYNFDISNPDKYNFPFQNYIFVGLISFSDPPKQSAPAAIEKLRIAGIKMIMFTGDQPYSAAAIAKKSGIINYKTNEDYKQEGYEPQTALQKASSVIIHGDMIVEAFKNGNDQGHMILNNWFKKPQIVFARTTTAQKLQIVKAYQNNGSIVGVIGKSVDDSPAILQADVGIAKGTSGSSVTMEIADMILLNDDFGSIVDGVEEGRKALDNIKKIIVYMLTSSMAQIWPFFVLIILRIPLPISIAFMLCISIGTDIYPAISLAYEEAEADIMTRRPRKSEQHLATARLLYHAYGQMGQIATAGGFFSYFLVMRLYGFPPSLLIGLLDQRTFVPEDKTFNDPSLCHYDPNEPKLGCSILPYQCNLSAYKFNQFPNWSLNLNNAIDLRPFFASCRTFVNPDGSKSAKYTLDLPFASDSNILKGDSPITGQPIAYSVEALFYAQSAYFVTVVMVQWSNIFACKSRQVSLIYTGFNKHIFIAIIVGICFFSSILYVPQIYIRFGGRPLNFFILGLPGLGFSMLLLIWQESRKYLMNLDSNNGLPNWWKRNLLW